MSCNFKTSGVALVTAIAMSAVVVTAAQAEITFTGWEGTETNHVHTLISITQTGAGDVFRVTPASAQFKCTSITATGTSATGDERTLTVQPHYEGCTAAGSSPMTVATTSCHLTYHVNVKVTPHEYTGTADVNCTTPGDAIHISIYTAAPHTAEHRICEFTMLEQNGINGITFTNKTDKARKYVELDVNANNIKMTPTEGGILCGESTEATTATGTYVGHGIITGRNTAGEEIDVTISGS